MYRFRIRGPMKLIHIAALEIALFPSGWSKWKLLIDWRKEEIGNRWRLDVGGPKRWMPFSTRPNKQGKYWAWWKKGNEPLNKCWPDRTKDAHVAP